VNIRTLMLTVVASLTLCLGCGGDALEELVDEQGEVVDALADVLEGVTDLDSLEQAKPRMAELGEQLAEQTRRWQETAPSLMTSPGDAQAYAQASQKLAASHATLQREMMRLAMDPELSPHVQELMRSLGASMQQELR